MKLKSVILAGLIAITSVDVAADRLLLPVSITHHQSPGGHGSLWMGELYAHNIGSEVARITTVDNLCAFITCPAPYLEVNPGETASLMVFSPSIILIEPGPSSRPQPVKFNARIYDDSRQMHDWGTEIPLVREHEFSAERIVLNNVPSDGSFRQMLRVYEWTGGASTDVRMQAFDMATGERIGEAVITLHSVLGFASELDCAYSQSSLQEIVTTDAPRLRLELSPLEPGRKIWAFVSVTHNETQRVTLITPQ